jgi:polygalacturonase
MRYIYLLKGVLFLILIAFSLDLSAAVNSYADGKVYNVKDFGAVGDGKTLNTIAINNAIDACAKAGGGTVLVPDGNYLTGTIVLKSNVTFYLEQDANILGTSDTEQYKSFKLRAENPQSPINITVKDSAVWCKALVLLSDVHDVAITGTGTIDGGSVKDARGEEGRRGPHGIFIGESKNIMISNIRVARSGNYNIIGLGVENVKVIGVTIQQGADGIHIRRGKNLLIENCKCYTADDAIAGGYWENMVIKDCLLNSSCNGIRIILPVTNTEIKDCQIYGPGVFGHHRGTVDNPLVARTLTGIIVQPGAWGLGAGKVAKVYIHDIRIRDMQTALTFVLNEGNTGEDIRVEDIVATGITRNACSFEAWPEGSSYENVKVKNVAVAYALNDPDLLKTVDFKRPTTESRPLPYWGFYLRNVKNIEFENITFDYAGKEIRPVMGFDLVNNVVLKNVKYKKVDGVQPFKYAATTTVKISN